MDDAILNDTQSKAAKLFAERRIRSEKYSQSGWGTCSEIGSETEVISDESEDELCFSDSDVPGYVEPVIRSATPTQPSQAISAGGRGSKLFKIRQQRMHNYTKTGSGKLTGLPTGKISDRQRCGYTAVTKYDRPRYDLDDPTGKGEPKPKIESAEEKKAKDPTFIDMSMPPPKKINLPKVVIEKPEGPLPFQYMRPSQYNGQCGTGERSSSRLNSFQEMESGSTLSSFKPWAAQGFYKSVKPPVTKMNASKMEPVVNVPNISTEFGHQIDEINTSHYKKINFSGKKNRAMMANGDFNRVHSKNTTAVGFKKPQMSKIQVNNRRMSVKDLLVNGAATPQYVPSTPDRSESPLKKNMHDTQIDNYMSWNNVREERCPTSAQELPPTYTMKNTPKSRFQPKKFTSNSATVWAPRS